MSAKDARLLQEQSQSQQIKALTTMVQRQSDINKILVGNLSILVDALSAADELVAMLDVPTIVRETNNAKLLKAAKDFLEKRQVPLSALDDPEVPLPKLLHKGLTSVANLAKLLLITRYRRKQQ